MARRIVQIAVGQRGASERVDVLENAETKPVVFALDETGLAWELDAPAEKWIPLPPLPAGVPRAD